MTGAAALVLAAGRSTRYRQAGGSAATKLVEPLGGKAVVAHVAEAALGSSARPVVVVTGHARAEVETALAGMDVVFVHNPDYAEGLSTSLKRGLAAIPAVAGAAIVLLGDMPLVTAEIIATLLGVAHRNPEAQAVVSVMDGLRGNPVLLRRALFGAAARLTGDEGARRLLRDPAVRVVEHAFATEAVRLDLDDPASVAALRASIR